MKRRAELRFVDVFQSYELFRHLGEFLPASDLFQLLDTCTFLKSFQKKLQTDRFLTQRVKAYLANAGLSLVGTFSGSSLLHALNGGDWRPRDVDVFVHADDFRGDLSTVQPIRDEMNGNPSYLKPYQDRTIFALAHSWQSGRLVQHIILNVPVRTHVEEHFTLDFLKNAFDGHLLEIQAKQSLQSRSSDVHNRGTIYKPLEWLYRYTCRGYHLAGFTITPLEVSEKRILKLSFDGEDCFFIHKKELPQESLRDTSLVEWTWDYVPLWGYKMSDWRHLKRESFEQLEQRCKNGKIKIIHYLHALVRHFPNPLHREGR